jgi:hypothetical protein
VTLRGLAPVQVAGGESKAQYEYLVQTIIDAVDAIGQAASSPELLPSLPTNSEQAREAQALRALLGLTSHTQSKTWRLRQEEAATALSISWDYFRHDRQDGLLRSVAEQILKRAQLDGSPSMFDRNPGVWAFANQNEIEHSTVEYIRRELPRRATMLEFSTATTGPILRALRDVDASIHLLAANPEKVSGWHQSRMRRALSDHLHIDFSDYDKLKVRLYSVPPALRGRLFTDLIILGWYTHRDNKRIDTLDPASVEVWGHDNAIIVGRKSNDHGAVLATWFSREFERLWTHRSTLDEATSASIIRPPE